MKKYNSKINVGVAMFVFGLLGLILAYCLSVQLLFPSGIVLLVTLLVIILYTGTAYSIKGNDLVVKAGLLYRKVIPIATIESIQTTNDAIASPALSLDRILISFAGNKSVLISPKRKLQFLQDLQNINPDLTVKAG